MTDELALTRAGALLDAGRHDEAIRILGDAAARSPDHADVQRLLAVALLRVGRKFDAQTTIARAIQLDPERPDSYLVSAEISMSLGSWVRAEQAARTACKLAPGNFRAHFAVVLAALKLDQLDIAWAEAGQVCRLAPWAATGHHARGLVFLRRGQWKAAELEYRDALKKAPTDPIYLNNLGVALMNQGNTEEAMEHFAGAGQLDVRTDRYRRNTALAAHRRVGGASLLPPFMRKIVLSHRYRRLSPAARTALEIDGASLEQESRRLRRRRWVALVPLVALVAGAIYLAVQPEDPTPKSEPMVIPMVGCDAKTRADLQENHMTCIEMGTPADSTSVP